jgi:hypothetical protein
VTTYTIAAGRSVTTLRGMLHEGEAIAARDLSGGKEMLDALVKQGAVVEHSASKPKDKGAA